MMFPAALLFTVLLKSLFLGTICEEFEVGNKGAKHDHDEELFERKIEAPNKTHILDALFKGYDKRVRPHYRGKPVLVSLYVVIDSFHDIKEEQMEYKVEVRLKEKWKDSRLAYGNASWFVRLKGETLAKVWYPDTLIENSRKHVVDDKTRTAFLFGDGTIYLSEWIQATLTSHMDFCRYPMDVQTLKLQIAGYSYDDTQVKYEWLHVYLKERDMTEFYVYKESFELRPTPFITGKHTAVVIEYKIRRRLQHFIMGFYLPCITCTCASWLQFWMDEKDIAGRAGVGTATVLAEIFLLEFSNQGMPKVGYLKAAEVFMVVSFVFIFSALVESAFVYKASSVILKPKIGDSQDKNNKGNTRSALENESSNKVITPAVSPPRLLCLETDHYISSCEEADNQPVKSILPNKHEGPKHCFLEEKTPQRAKSLGLMIDEGARVLFPLTYATFTVVYFALVLCFPE